MYSYQEGLKVWNFYLIFLGETEAPAHLCWYWNEITIKYLLKAKMIKLSALLLQYFLSVDVPDIAKYAVSMKIAMEKPFVYFVPV